MFDDKIKEQIKGILANLKDKVNLILFSQDFECNSCRDSHIFCEEIVQLSDKLNLTIFDFQKDKKKADYYGIDKIPAILLLNKDDVDTGVRFYGTPGGYEINSFLTALHEVSGNKEILPDYIINKIKAINKQIHIQVLVTLNCPYCPSAVVTAHRLALENKNIKADMIETSTFPYLSIRYNVQGVPKIIINEKHELIGAQLLEAFLELIEKI